MGAALVLACGQGGAGHQVSHFPSYYPDEISIAAIDPVVAGKGLGNETVHAYVGAAPRFAGPVPEHVRSVRSLGSFLVLSFDAASTRFASADARCTAARGILAALRDETTGGFVFHPYPVTPSTHGRPGRRGAGSNTTTRACMDSVSVIGASGASRLRGSAAAPGSDRDYP